MSKIMAVHREPMLSLAPHTYYLSERTTLAEMVALVKSLPKGWPRHEHDVICVQNEVVPRGAWHLVTPKAKLANGTRVEVTFHAPPMGGGGEKNPLAIVAAIALTAVTGGIASGTILGGLTAGNVVLANALAGVVGFSGATLISGLVGTPTLDPAPEGPKPEQRGSAAAQGNVLSQNGSIPRVVGTRKVYPPFLAEPFTYFSGFDEVVEVVVGLAGPHQLVDIEIKDAAIGDMSGVEFETREGWAGDPKLTLVTRQTRTELLRSDLVGQTVSGDDGTVLESATGSFDDALPQPLQYATRESPDEAWLQIVMPQGLHRKASDTELIRIPFRLRIRPAGETTWTNLPELHYEAADISEQRATIQLIWQDSPSVTEAASEAKGWVEARIATKEQTAAPSSVAYTSHGDFDKGSGSDDWMDKDNLGSTKIQNVRMDRYEAKIYLDTATFPKGRYEIEIKRGYAIRSAQYSDTNYTIGGAVKDPFWYQTGVGPEIQEDQDGIANNVILARGVSIRNEAPVARDGLALIAIRARNKSVENLSVVASGYTQDWDGSGWVDWVTSSNPAPHYRDVIAGMLNADPVPEAIVDDDGLVSWRTACASAGYEANAIFEGESVKDVTRVIASAGYARPYESEIWGVIRDYDRSAETPVQLFTPRNAADVRWEKAFPMLPHGMRATFEDRDRSYERRQITVWPDPKNEGSARVEQVTFDPLVTVAEVEERVAYDLESAKLRGAFWSFEAPSSAIVCRRGSLIGLTHDMMTGRMGQGRIVDFETDNDGDVTRIRLDDKVKVYFEDYFEDVTNLETETDVALIGAKTGVILNRTNNTRTTHTLTGTTGETDWLEFAAPVSATGLDEGILAAVGPLNEETRRMIVVGMQSRSDLQFTLTCVDEAPELWT